MSVKKRGKSWRSAWGPDEVVQRVRPVEFTGNLPNPHRGTTTFQRFQGDPVAPGPQSPRDTFGPVKFRPAPGRIPPNPHFTPWTTLSYCRWPWRWMEPRPGRYDWSMVDGALKAAHDCGQTLQVRFQPFTEEKVELTERIPARRRPPGTAVDVPDWYWDTGARWTTRGKVGGVYEPDSNDPRWIGLFSDFIRTFADRYDGHPDLESIDVAYAGHWGESGGNSTAATARKLVEVYLRSFRRTQLLSMLGTHGCAYAAAVRGRNIGWRADCYGDLRARGGGVVPDRLCWNHMHDAYPKEIEHCGVKDAWKHAPVTFETCGNVMTWWNEKYALDWIIDQGYKYHMSVFMPKSVRYPRQWMDKLAAFDNKIGYRFVMRQLLIVLEAKPGSKINAEVFIDNVGCAPIYRPYKLALRFRQGRHAHTVVFKEDIRRWLPGVSWCKEPVTIPRGLKRGTAEVAVGIVDAAGTPRVRLAIKPQDPDGWHTVAKMEIT